MMPRTEFSPVNAEDCAVYTQFDERLSNFKGLSQVSLCLVTQSIVRPFLVLNNKFWIVLRFTAPEFK